MTNPYRDDYRKPTGPNPWGVRLLVTIREWAWVAVVASGAAYLFSLASANFHADRADMCAEACDAINMPRSLQRGDHCYCIDDQGRARQWPKRAEDDDCDR